MLKGQFLIKIGQRFNVVSLIPVKSIHIVGVFADQCADDMNRIDTIAGGRLLDFLISFLFCESMLRILRYFFSNELFPEWVRRTEPDGIAGWSTFLLPDGTLVTAHTAGAAETTSNIDSNKTITRRMAMKVPVWFDAEQNSNVKE